MSPLRTAFAAAALAAVLLAACTAGDPGPTQTAPVGAPPTLPPTAAAPTADGASKAQPASATPAPTPTAAPSATPASAASPTAAESLGALSGDPFLRTYRSLVAIQVNAALVGETVRQVQAGRIDSEEMPVAALAL